MIDLVKHARRIKFLNGFETVMFSASNDEIEPFGCFISFYTNEKFKAVSGFGESFGEALDAALVEVGRIKSVSGDSSEPNLQK